jgi:hypothetical protein
MSQKRISEYDHDDNERPPIKKYKKQQQVERSFPLLQDWLLTRVQPFNIWSLLISSFGNFWPEELIVLVMQYTVGLRITLFSLPFGNLKWTDQLDLEWKTCKGFGSFVLVSKKQEEDEWLEEPALVPHYLTDAPNMLHSANLYIFRSGVYPFVAKRKQVRHDTFTNHIFILTPEPEALCYVSPTQIAYLPYTTKAEKGELIVHSIIVDQQKIIARWPLGSPSINFHNNDFYPKLHYSTSHKLFVVIQNVTISFISWDDELKTLKQLGSNIPIENGGHKRSVLVQDRWLVVLTKTELVVFDILVASLARSFPLQTSKAYRLYDAGDGHHIVYLDDNQHVVYVHDIHTGKHFSSPVQGSDHICRLELIYH